MRHIAGVFSNRYLLLPEDLNYFLPSKFNLIHVYENL